MLMKNVQAFIWLIHNILNIFQSEIGYIRNSFIFDKIIQVL